jgi:RNA polymerase sigma-70 factor (ECF subfamily)
MIAFRINLPRFSVVGKALYREDGSALCEWIVFCKNNGGSHRQILLLILGRIKEMDVNQESQGKSESSASGPSTDHSLIRRYQSGSQDAATELYRRYADRLRGLARAQLSADLAKQVEIDDIVQSVFGSFFRGVNNALYDAPAGEDLWKLLLVIAVHKIRNKGVFHRAAKRDARRTNNVDDIAELRSSEIDASAAHVFLQLVVDEALGSMPAQQKQVVELRLEGFEVIEIAAKTGRSKRTVERLLQQARVKLGALLAEGK